MNETILSLQNQLNKMKSMIPSAAASDEQIKQYFATQDEVLEGILKTLSDEKDATTSEMESIKEAVKEFRNALKELPSRCEQLTQRDIYYNLGKGIVATWNKDHETLGKLKFCPNIRSEKWNNPSDFTWIAGKGFTPSKGILGEPMGNLATNDQFLINPIYEETIMQEAAKKSVMMNLVTNRPMTGPSLFMNERDRGGIKLNWLTAYGQKIDPTKSNAPTRVELKAHTLAGYIPFYDEFEEDVFVDLGKMFIDDFNEAYGQEFDRQCLTADEDPFTGAMNVKKANIHTAKTADISKLTYIDFRDAELKVKPEERKECEWFFSETVLNHIVNIQDANGNPIWRRPGDGLPGLIDGYRYHDVSILPQFADIKEDTAFAIFMNPKKIVHGNRKGIEIKRFDGTTESLEYGENFLRFRKRDGFLVTRPAANIVILKTAKA